MMSVLRGMHGERLAAAVPSPSPTTLPPATAVAGAQAPHAAVFDPTSGVAIVLYALLLLGLFVIVTPIILRRGNPDFFRIPFITWYLLHYTIAALGIVGIVILGLTGTITGEVISALFGSLLGYVLGSTTAHTAAQAAQANANQALGITTASPLPPGAVGTAYTTTLTAAGGTPLIVGSSPPGRCPLASHSTPRAGRSAELRQRPGRQWWRSRSPTIRRRQRSRCCTSP